MCHELVFGLKYFMKFNVSEHFSFLMHPKIIIIETYGHITNCKINHSTFVCKDLYFKFHSFVKVKASSKIINSNGIHQIVGMDFPQKWYTFCEPCKCIPQI